MNSAGGDGGHDPSDTEQQAPPVLVLDLGSGSIKAGWCGEDAPRVVVPSVLLDTHGQAMPAGVMESHSAAGVHGPNVGGNSAAAGAERSEYVVGHQALHALAISSTRLAHNQTHNLTLISPIERGEIKDFTTLQKILDHIFKFDLGISPKDYPVLLSVSPLCSPECRMELAKMMFDFFAVPALCIANAAVLSLYSTGRTTGLVMDVGAGASYVVPVYEGFALRHALLSVPLGGGDLTLFLARSLGERGFNFVEGQHDTVRDIKEKLCRVKPHADMYNVTELPALGATSTSTSGSVYGSTPAQRAAAAAAVLAAAGGGGGDPNGSSSGGQVPDESGYELPDGAMIRLDEHCRFNTLENLFFPQRYAQYMGLHMSGGANMNCGIPPSAIQLSTQPISSLGSSMPGSAGGGGGGFAGAFADKLATPTSAGVGSIVSQGSGGGGGAGGGGSGSGSGGKGSQIFGRLTSGGSTGGGSGTTGSGPHGLGRGGGGGGGGGDIQLDLSTNDLVGIHMLAYAALHMCDSFLRRELLSNIVLAGGSTMAKGFGERMKKELTQLMRAHSDSMQDATSITVEDDEDNEQQPEDIGLTIITDSQRKYAAWIGASMYASLPTFNTIKTTAEAYKRDESIVHKKYF